MRRFLRGGRHGRGGTRVVLALLMLLLLTGCRVESRRVEVAEARPPLPPAEIGVPVKAHLLTGEVVLFREGATVTGDSVVGSGVRYDLTLRDSTRVDGIALDSLAALESFSPALNQTESIVLSAAATGVGATAVTVGTLALLKALFGSCPTVYVDSAGSEALQAELFSYSIAPLFEMRDVDAVRTTASTEGHVTLTIRNEALETHYLNHLELLEVPLAPGETLLPDPSGRPILIGPDAVPPIRATDGSGRDVGAELGQVDGREFRSAESRLTAAVAGEFGDHVELEFPRTASGRAGLVLRVRNSLLNTVLFYDVMLGSGAHSVQWLGGDLETIGRAAELGRWYSDVMGIRVSVHDGDGWTEVGRVPDVGPIAWKDVVVPFDPPPGETLRIRLNFVADGYRIESAGLAGVVREAKPRTIPVAEVMGSDGVARPAAVRALAGPDGDYLITGPGDRFEVRFDAGPGEAPRAYLLASQGYYIEWVRGDWVRSPRQGAPFQPGDDALRATFRRWAETRATFEDEFHRHRIPTR